MKRFISSLLAITLISGVFSGIADPPPPPPDDCEKMDLCNLDSGDEPMIGPLQVQGAEDCWRYLDQKALSCDFEYLIKLEQLKDDDGATHCDNGNPLIVNDEMTPVTLSISPCNMKETCNLTSSCSILLEKDQILHFQPCEPGGINFSGSASDLVQNPCTSDDPPKAMEPADIIAYDTDITPTLCGAFKGYRRADTMTVAYEVLPDSGLIAESVLLTFQGGGGGTRELPTTPLGAGLTYSWDGKVGEALADLGPGQYTMGMQVSPVEGQSPFAIYDFAISESSKTIWVVDVDMLADSNNNGDLDSGDNLVELDSPGMLVGVGGAGRPLWLYKPDPGTLPEGQVYLSMVSGSGLIEVRNSDTGALIYSSDKARSANLWPQVSQSNLYCTVTAPEDPEQTPGEIVLEYQYINGSFQCTDRVKVTVVRVDIAEPDENDVYLKGQEIAFDGQIEPAGLGGLSYSWSVLQGTCNPSTANTQDFVTTFESEGIIQARLRVMAGAFLLDKIRTIETVRPEVTNISWKNDHDLKSGATGDERIEDPIWIKPLGGTLTRNEPGAYTKDGTAKAELQIEGIKSLTHTTSVQVSGDGNTENFYAQGASFHNWTWNPGELQLDSSELYSSVNFYDTLNVSWYYRVQKLDSSWGNWVEMNSSAHKLYTTFSAPVLPESIPHVDILDYACHWAANSQNLETICSYLLNNGFSPHYTWNYNCHRLASDFIRLSASVGLSGSLHRWASRGGKTSGNIGWMCYQRTKEFTPVGGSEGTRDWSWHQWAEAAGSQIDPSAAASKPGSWGGYEDDLFTHYYRCTSSNPFGAEWVSNLQGQSSGCEEHPTNCTYENPYPLVWLGPDPQI